MFKLNFKVRDFDLYDIFECGQCFRWEQEEDGSYSGIAGGRAVNVKFVPLSGDSLDGGGKYVGELEINYVGVCDGIILKEKPEQEFWGKYFDLDRDYGEIKESLSQHDVVMARAVGSGQGIRILRQDLWEAIISFIISQNNNIPRIKKCIENLCMHFGERIEPIGAEENIKFSKLGLYNFPKAEVLSSLKEEDLAPIHLGYRSKYIIATSQALVEAEKEGRISKLAEVSTEECREFLESLTGVGPKVANCILLFGMARLESFPIDVWVRRVMSQLYGIEENDLKGMKAFAEEHFGNYGGIAQQYLFHYMRNGAKEGIEI